ncbi:hypothetical protein ACJX0J_020668, partial [Zea mays]
DMAARRRKMRIGTTQQPWIPIIKSGMLAAGKNKKTWGSIFFYAFWKLIAVILRHFYIWILTQLNFMKSFHLFGFFIVFLQISPLHLNGLIMVILGFGHFSHFEVHDMFGVFAQFDSHVIMVL